jgi:hypothetical protein
VYCDTDYFMYNSLYVHFGGKNVLCHCQNYSLLTRNWWSVWKTRFNDSNLSVCKLVCKLTSPKTHKRVFLKWSKEIIWWVLILVLFLEGKKHVFFAYPNSPWDTLREWDHGQGPPLSIASLEQLELSALLNWPFLTLSALGFKLITRRLHGTCRRLWGRLF